MNENAQKHPYTYKKAAIKDLKQLAAIRIQVLCAANLLEEDTNMETVHLGSHPHWTKVIQSHRLHPRFRPNETPSSHQSTITVAPLKVFALTASLRVSAPLPICSCLA